MGRGFLFAVTGLTLAVSSIGARAEAIHELRVLVARINHSSKQEFVVEGQALMSEDNTPVGHDRISCRREAAVASPLLASTTMNSPSSVNWVCRSGSRHWNVSGPLRFTDRSGFLRIGKQWYRGSLELVDRGKHLWVVNNVKLNDYLTSLLHGEMPKNFESEALKAQAVAARSYAIATALARRAAGSVFDISDDTFDQVYPGAQTESARGALAVSATADEYLVVDSKVLKSFYHAASGGFSELAENVWRDANAREGFQAFEAKANVWDKGLYAWNLQLSAGMFLRYPELGELVDVQISERTGGNRVRQLRLVGSLSEKIIRIQDLERMLGPAWIKSRKFEISKDGSTWKLSGEGWGHGVGLSQIAANAMAKAGKTYREILEFHYPKAILRKFEAADRVKILAGPNAR